MQEDICSYTVISDKNAKIIKDFILNNKNEQFIIHCELGQSRSVAVAMAIECLLSFNGKSKKYLSKISKEKEALPIYEPNHVVYNKIIKK